MSTKKDAASNSVDAVVIKRCQTVNGHFIPGCIGAAAACGCGKSLSQIKAFCTCVAPNVCDSTTADKLTGKKRGAKRMSKERSTGPQAKAHPAHVHRVVVPCPFCGGTKVEFEEENYKWCKVHCVECGASSGSVRRFQLDRHGNTILDKSDADERALAEWNRRAKVKCIHDLAKEFNENITADY